MFEKDENKRKIGWNGPFKKESSGIQKKIQKVKLECLKEQ